MRVSWILWIVLLLLAGRIAAAGEAPPVGSSRGSLPMERGSQVSESDVPFPALRTLIVETCGTDEEGNPRLGCDVNVTFVSEVRRIEGFPDQFEYRYLVENHGTEPVTVLWWGLAISSHFLDRTHGERMIVIDPQSQWEMTFVGSAPPRKTYTNAEVIVRFPHGYYSREVVAYFGDEL